MTAEYAVEVHDLRKTYRDDGTEVGLRGVDLVVGRGRIHGLLGPNGAGKTTLVRILATLLRPESGSAVVAGFDVVRQPREVRRRIGVVGQGTAVDEDLTGRENLVLFGRLGRLGASAARRRAGELLDEFELADAAGRRVGTYSGGMRRRLDLAAALLARPEVLLVDEPTTGLDPASRAAVWRRVAALAAEGTTVLLTTQYLEEADELADGITLLAAGRVVAEGTAADLKARVGTDVVTLTAAGDADAAARIAERVAVGAIHRTGAALRVPVAERGRDTQRLLAELAAAGIVVADVAVAGPTLDDAFLQLTGAVSAPGEDPVTDAGSANIEKKEAA